MSIAIYDKTRLIGGVVIESDTIGWLYRGTERIGRIEVDWGDEQDLDHEAEVLVAGVPCARVTLERYGRGMGKIQRGIASVGEVVPRERGVCVLYQDNQPVGKVEVRTEGVSGKHLILFGGAGAAALLGVCE
ncbi:MAG: hypothetical protein JXB85_00505 [Anaerolineales bacterium]|nr:hypothetical protein [Anaerolineales bacterium]